MVELSDLPGVGEKTAEKLKDAGGGGGCAAVYPGEDARMDREVRQGHGVFLHQRRPYGAAAEAYRRAGRVFRRGGPSLPADGVSRSFGHRPLAGELIFYF